MSDPNKPKGGENDEVGFCKPPKAHQFKPGHQRSKGPRQRKSLESELKKALGKKITMRLNGEVSAVSVVDALIKRVIAKAIAGERWAFEFVVGEMRRIDAAHGGNQVTALIEEDRAILLQIAAGMKGEVDEN